MISGGGALLNVSNSKRSTCVPTETVALVPEAGPEAGPEALLSERFADRVFGIFEGRCELRFSKRLLINTKPYFSLVVTRYSFLFLTSLT
jgi:hypothetical protein